MLVAAAADVGDGGGGGGVTDARASFVCMHTKRQAI
jgi:hypothetical protein